MITKIEINGFKSFNNFEMQFTPMTVIAGINGSGKSNLFDAIKLISRLAEVDNIKRAFKEQRGEFIELFTQYTDNDYANEMEFAVEMLLNKSVKDAWGNSAELKYTRLRYELKLKRIVTNSGIEDIVLFYESLINLKHREDTWIKDIISKSNTESWRPKVIGGRGMPYIETIVENNIPTVFVPQDGTTGNKRRFPLVNSTRTVLSSFDSVDFPHVYAAKEEMKSWRFMQLNPEELRKPTPKDRGDDSIDSSGRNLAATLYRIKQEDSYNLIEISRKIHSFLPNFISIDVEDDKENKQFLLKLKDNDHKEYTSRVLSEGTLRIITLCILEFDSKYDGLLCFEEPENGIHPLRIDDMANLLKDLSTDFSDSEMPLRQVIVNTHSPVLVNCIYNWTEDKNVSIWLSQMKSRNTDIVKDQKVQRIHISITDIKPVLKENNGQLSINCTAQEGKLTLSLLNDYLSTTKYERN